MPATQWTTPPDGYAFAPLASGVVSICVLLRVADEPQPTPLLLRQDRHGRAMVGALVDSAGLVLDWLVIRIQATAAGLESGAGSGGSNRLEDDAFDRWWSGLSARGGARVIRTPWLAEPPPPTWIDGDRREIVTPEIDGCPLELCRDEAALQVAGLPSYAASTSRFLRPARKDGPFVAAPGTPLADGAMAVADACPEVNEWAPLNPGAGRIGVRRWSPIGLRDAFRLLGGDGWHGVMDSHRRSGLVPGLHATLEHGATAYDLASRTLGREGHLAEALHLKLRLLADVVGETASAAQAADAPLLDLHPSMFEVDAEVPRRGLPVLWTFTASLAEPPAVETFRPADGAALVSATPNALGGTLYQPIAGGAERRGEATVRLTDVDESPGGFRIRGVVSSPDLTREVGASDVVFLTIPVEGNVEIGAVLRPSDHPEAEGSDRPFVSLTVSLPSTVAEAMGRAIGRPMHYVRFRTQPQVGSPVDGYAVAVMAIEALLTDDEQDLGVAIERMHVLARAVAELADVGPESGGPSPLPERIRTVLDADGPVMASLGPHRLAPFAGTRSEDPFAEVPAALWCEVLAWIVSLLPGKGPDSRASDLGDPPDRRPGQLLEEAAADLEPLLRRSRSITVVDLAENRDVDAAIRRMTLTLQATSGRA